MKNTSLKKVWSKLRSSPLFRFIIGLFLSGLFLYLSVRNVNIQEAWEAITEANYFIVGIALISVGINLLGKSIRWKILLGIPGEAIKLSKVTMSFLTGKMLNTFFPIGIGEVSRVIVIGAMGPGYAFVLGTLAVEKVLDLISYALVFIIVLFSIQLPEWIGHSGYALIIFTIVLAIVFLVIIYQRDRVITSLERIIQIFPQRVESFFKDHIITGLASLDVFLNGSDVLKITFLTALIWGTATLTNHILFIAFGIDLPITASVLLLIALQAGISIPALPGSIGVFEYICVLTLGYYGIDEATALSYGILLHAVVYLPLIIGGLLSFWLLQLGYSDVGQLQASRSNHIEG